MQRGEGVRKPWQKAAWPGGEAESGSGRRRGDPGGKSELRGPLERKSVSWSVRDGAALPEVGRQAGRGRGSV